MTPETSRFSSLPKTWRSALVLLCLFVVSTACPRVPDHGVEYILVVAPGSDPSPEQVQQVADVIRSRMDALKVRGASVRIDGARLYVRVPGADVSHKSTWMRQTGSLEFWRLDDADNPFEKWSASGHIVDARAEQQKDTGQFVVIVQLDEKGTQRFADMTKSHIGKKIAIVYDGEVMSEPVVRDAITKGEIMVTMGWAGQVDPGSTERKARELAAAFRGGALPVPVIILEAGAY